MRDFIQWLDAWTLDIATMDAEHRELVSLFNRLAHCVCDLRRRQCGSPVEQEDELTIRQLVITIGQHAKRHFTHEEDLMLHLDYPDYDSHRYEHVTLLAEYAELVRDVRHNGCSCLDRSTMDALKMWLIVHIAGADARFADFYHQRAAGNHRPSSDPFVENWLQRA